MGVGGGAGSGEEEDPAAELMTAIAQMQQEIRRLRQENAALRQLQEENATLQDTVESLRRQVAEMSEASAKTTDMPVHFGEITEFGHELLEFQKTHGLSDYGLAKVLGAEQPDIKNWTVNKRM